MMGEVIRQETAVFFLSVLHGIGLTFLYDVIRALRRAFSHGLALISVEDFLFWIMAGFLTFCFAFQNTDGVIRGYAAVGIGLGAVLYHVSVSSVVLGCISGILKLIRSAAAAVWRTLSKPVKKLWQIWKKMIEFARKKGYNAIKMRGNRPSDDSGENICENGRIKRGRQYGRKKKAAQQK